MRKNLLFAAVVAMLSVSLAFAQVKQGTVLERDVRAEIGFLASDAMEGRGSGSQFERIAAEYIGSQFMQFGLEPAGKSGWDGKPTFVQTVEVPGRKSISNLAISYGSGQALKFGDDFVALSVSSGAISGPLLKLKKGETAQKGAIVLYLADPAEKFAEARTAVAKFARDGASAVIVTATTEVNSRWTDLKGRPTGVSRFGTMIFLNDAGSEKSRALENGTKIDITGDVKTGPVSHTWNAMGKITGSDPTLSPEVILITSHLDHLGTRENAPGDDKIYNGADDDASGSVAVLELARTLGASAKKPKRTVYFVCFGSEESGGYGAGYFVNNLPFPQDKLIANLEFEMIGRPDAKVKPEELWLTGYERSDLGPELAKRGAKLVQDPHPEENFFQRSDNIQLARRGIIAHTVSSFGLHKDYHQASDEVRKIDFVHMTRAINSMVEPVIWLVNSNFRPKWNEGMKP